MNRSRGMPRSRLSAESSPNNCSIAVSTSPAGTKSVPCLSMSVVVRN